MYIDSSSTVDAIGKSTELLQRVYYIAMEFTWPELPNTVPSLEEEASNWATFTPRFQEAMLATSQWGYPDGINTCPVPKDAAHPTNSPQMQNAKPSQCGRMKMLWCNASCSRGSQTGLCFA